MELDASTPEGVYDRGILDYRKEQQKIKMESPKRNRSRSRSPIQRSRSPRRDDRRGRDRRSGGASIKGTKGKEYRVYVNNLNFQVKWMNLKDLMKKVGPVSHVEIFTGQDGRSRGCGVVEFEHADDAAKAIKEYDGIQHEGRKIHVRQDQVNDSHYEEQLRTQKEKTRKDRDREMMGRGGPMQPMGGPGGLLGALGNLGGGGIGNLSAGLIQMLNAKNGDPINATVFISNLDYNIRWQELKDQLRRAGNCKTCTITTEEETKKSKGYGQAVFESPMEALNAIAMFNGFEMGRDRRAIVIRLDRQAPLNQLLQQIGITEITQNTLVQFQSMALLSQLGGLQGLSALTGGLAGGLGGLAGALGGAAGGLGGAAGGLGSAAQNLQNYQNQGNLGAIGSGQSSLSANNQQGLGALSSLGLGNLGGLGNLLTQSQQGGSSINNALSSLGNNFGASSNSQSQYQQLSSGSNIGASNYTAGQQLSNYSITGGRGNSGGFATQDSRRSSDIGSGYGYNTGSSSGGSVAKTRVFVRNLPFSLKWQDLKDRFRDAGRIIRADIKQDDNNRSKGCGTVTFETADEAVKAISIFNGMRIDGREIEVRMDRVAGDR